MRRTHAWPSALSARTCHTIHVCTHHGTRLYTAVLSADGLPLYPYLPRASLWNPHAIAHTRRLFFFFLCPVCAVQYFSLEPYTIHLSSRLFLHLQSGPMRVRMEIFGAYAALITLLFLLFFVFLFFFSRERVSPTSIFYAITRIAHTDRFVFVGFFFTNFLRRSFARQINPQQQFFYSSSISSRA